MGFSYFFIERRIKMNKPNMTKFVKNAKALLSEHSPEILVGIGIAGMITTTVLAVKATPKALKLIEERKEEEKLDTLTPVETIQTTWKCYIPTIISGVTSIACLIGASSVHVKRNAALATAYKLSETALTEYREKVVETIGESKEKIIKEKVDKERIEKNPVSKNEVIVTSKGNTLCFDVLSGRYFKSDIDLIKRVENNINKRMFNDMYISLNEFYIELGLEPIGIGDDLGWSVDKGMIDIDFSSQLADDGTPCLVMNFNIAPRYDYYSAY